jgi:Fic family protein
MNLSGTIQQIDALKKEADALQPVNPDFEHKFWNKYRLEFNYNSNHIEGNTLTYGHTQLLLMFDKVGSDSYSLRELEEMKAHDTALKLVKEAALDPDHVLSEKFIKEINQIILVRPYYKEAITLDGQPTRRLIEPGQYKKYPNSVLLENGETFDYASPGETSAQMGDLIEWIRKEEEAKELHPVQLAALVHYRFVRIHPFDDSNGRTSRLLMNYYLMRNGYAPIVIESSDKKNYLTALNKADVGDIEAFVIYITENVLLWQEKFTKCMKGGNISDDLDLDKEIELIKRSYSDKDRERFNKKNTELLFNSSLLPLINDTIDTLRKFDSLFKERRILFGLNSPSRLIQVARQAENLFITDFVSRLAIQNFLVLEYQHQEFLKSDNHDLNYISKIQVYFDKYSYSIIINDKKKMLEKNYPNLLSKEDIKNIVDHLSNNELTFIKRNLS